MSEHVLFSIVTVCLNPGKDLSRTVKSVLSQDYGNFEYIIKDGLSEDGTTEFSCSDPRVSFVSQADEGIYDAMNQALELCSGKYVNFLNAGDTFRVNDTLSEAANLLEEEEYPPIVYVDRYNEKLDAVTHYPSTLSPWYLFRRPVCHQALFVRRRLLSRVGGFDTSFRILADYDVLLNLVLEKQVRYAHCPIIGVSYQDDGMSSNPENREQKMSEVQRLRKRYFPWIQRMVYSIIWRGTLPGVRIRLVRQEQFPWLRKMLYR